MEKIFLMKERILLHTAPDSNCPEAPTCLSSPRAHLEELQARRIWIQSHHIRKRTMGSHSGLRVDLGFSSDPAMSRITACGVFSGVLDPEDILHIRQEDQACWGWEEWPWGSTPLDRPWILTWARGLSSVSQTWRPAHLDVVASVGSPAPVPSQGPPPTSPCIPAASGPVLVNWRDTQDVVHKGE